jgi:hypothetical protein
MGSSDASCRYFLAATAVDTTAARCTRSVGPWRASTGDGQEFDTGMVTLFAHRRN